MKGQWFSPQGYNMLKCPWATHHTPHCSQLQVRTLHATSDFNGWWTVQWTHCRALCRAEPRLKGGLPLQTFKRSACMHPMWTKKQSCCYCISKCSSLCPQCGHLNLCIYFFDRFWVIHLFSEAIFIDHIKLLSIVFVFPFFEEEDMLYLHCYCSLRKYVLHRSQKSIIDCFGSLSTWSSASSNVGMCKKVV